MPNWCFNSVTFEGSKKSLKKLDSIFKTMIKEQDKNDGEGQHPTCIEADKENDLYMFDIDYSDGCLTFTSRWSPALTTIQKLAEYLKLNSYEHFYEESGNMIYGTAFWSEGICVDYCLQDSDYAEFTYDEENDTYTFRGEKYESDAEILETLLEEKIKPVSVN